MTNDAFREALLKALPEFNRIMEKRNKTFCKYRSTDRELKFSFKIQFNVIDILQGAIEVNGEQHAHDLLFLAIGSLAAYASGMYRFSAFTEMADALPERLGDTFNPEAIMIPDMEIAAKMGESMNDVIAYWSEKIGGVRKGDSIPDRAFWIGLCTAVEAIDTVCFMKQFNTKQVMLIQQGLFERAGLLPNNC